MPTLRRPSAILAATLALLLHSQATTAAEQDAKPGAVPRPAAIQTEGVPEISPQIVGRLAQYQNTRAAGFQGWAPDGSGMLIGTRFGNTVQLHRVYQPGGRREQITFLPEPVSGRFLPGKHIPGKRAETILLNISSGGDENFQVLRHDRQHFRTTRLTDGKSRNGVGAIRRDGSALVLSSNRRNGRDTDLYLMDPFHPDDAKMLMQVDGEFWSAIDWSPDGRFLLLLRQVSINETYPALLEVGDDPDPKRRPTLLPAAGDKPAAYGPLAFAPDGKSAYIATDARGEFRQLARVDLNTGKYAWLTDDLPWDVEGLEVEPTTGRVAFTINADGASRLFLLENGQRRELKTPLGVIGGLEFSPDGKRLGLTISRADLPADAYALDLATGELTRWTYSELGGLNPVTFVTPTRISYPSFDGRQIPAYYYRPKKSPAAGKHGVLVMIHGGPESQYRPDFSGLIQFYTTELGLAVVCPNVRGSAGYGKTYLQLDNAEKREDSVKDIGGLLDWIAKQPELDSQRVAVSGGSYGGYMVLASLVHHGERIKAGIDIVGIANFVTLLERTAPYRRDLRRVEYGDERDPKMRAVFDRISPVHHAAKIRSALLVAHGKNDPRVPFSEAEQIAAAVRQTGRPVWTVYAQNEGHGFAKKDNRDYLTAVEATFLEQHLAKP